MRLFQKETIAEMIKGGKLDKVKQNIHSDNSNEQDQKGHVPLYYALMYQQVEIASYLLSQGSALSCVADMSPDELMQEVLKTGNARMIQLFLDQGETLPESIEDQPILCYVVSHENFNSELLEVILDNGEDIDRLHSDYNGLTTLAYVLSQKSCSMEVVKVLLEAGADVNYASSNSERPLVKAIENIHLPTMASDGECSLENLLPLLQSYGVAYDFDFELKTGGVQSLAKRVLSHKNRGLKGLLLLLNHGFTLSQQDIEMCRGYIDVNDYDQYELQWIVTQNKCLDTQLPLELAFYNVADYPEIVSQAKPNTPETTQLFMDLVVVAKGMTYEQRIPLLTELLHKGADINAPVITAGGQEGGILTKLLSFCYGVDKYEDLLKWLVEQGARIENFGHSAFLWAIWFNKIELVRYFASQGADILYTESDGSTMFTKIVTWTPFNANYYDCNERVDMLKVLIDICKENNVAFPIDTPFIYGDQYDKLDDTAILPNMVQMYLDTDYQLGIIEVLHSCGWDINKKFKGYDEFGNVLAQVLAISNVDEKTVVAILDQYPEIDITNPGMRDPLLRVLQLEFSLPTIQRFVDKVADINKTIVRKFDDFWIKSVKTSYLEFVIDVYATNSDKEKVIKVTEIGRMLLEAGLDPNKKVMQTLQDRYMSGGAYRKEKSLLEMTLLMEGVEGGYFELFKLLLDYGADPYQRMCYFEETIMHFLMQRSSNYVTDNDRIKYLEELDRRGLLQIESTTNNGATALLYAAGKCRTGLVAYLLGKGANPNAIGGFDQSTALNRAISNFNWVAKEDRAATVKLLIEGGADIEFIDNDGYSPLMAAAAFGCYTAAEELIKQGAEVNRVNEDGKSALHFAITDSYNYDTYPDGKEIDQPDQMDEELKLKIIRLLVKNGADINASEKEILTPLMYAILYGYTTITNEMMGLKSRKPFAFDTGKKSEEENEETIKLNADINAVDAYGRTAFMMAAKYGGAVMLRKIGMKRKAQQSFHNTESYEENILHYFASRVHHEEGHNAPSRGKVASQYVQTLMEQFNVPYIKNKEAQTPLHYAAMYGMPELIRFLVDKGVDINETDHWGNTALIYALSSDFNVVTEEESVETVKALIDGGIHVNMPNEKGDTPLSIATERERIEEVTLLQQAGAKVLDTTVGFKPKED